MDLRVHYLSQVFIPLLGSEADLEHILRSLTNVNMQQLIEFLTNETDFSFRSFLSETSGMLTAGISDVEPFRYKINELPSNLNGEPQRVFYV